MEDGFGPSEQRATRQPHRKNNSTKSLDANVRATSYNKENSLHGQSPNDVHVRDQGHPVVPDYMHNDSSTYLFDLVYLHPVAPMSVSLFSYSARFSHRFTHHSKKMICFSYSRNL